MKIPQKMFYDEVKRFYASPVEKAAPYLMTIKDEKGRPYTFDVIKTPRDNLANVLENSKVFLIENRVVDDLSNIPHETDYEDVLYLPFPRMFLEFTSPLEIKVDEDKSKMVKAMLLGRSKDVEFEPPLKFKQAKDDDFNFYLFSTEFKEGAALPDAIYMNLGNLPEIEFVSEYFSYKYNPENGVFPIHSASTPAGKKYLSQFSEKHPETLRNSFQKMLDLFINIVAYINADNAVINTYDRSPPNLEQINQKRKRKNKKPLPKSKPVKWISIKQAEMPGEVSKGKNCGLEEPQEIRGHFQRYWTGTGEHKKRIRRWVEPYRRGPADCEHKESRYKL